MMLMASASYGGDLTLRLPIIVDAQDSHHFFHDVMREALEHQGHKVSVQYVSVPQNRARLMLARGEITAFWMLRTERRDSRFLAIPGGLTQGVAGQRILLIKPGQQALFDRVNSLQDFRDLELVAGMGTDWFDVDIWRLNRLPVKEHSGNWNAIYRILKNRREYAYFPRGTHEIISDAIQYPGLAIEQRLVLEYERDYIFYLSKEGEFARPEYRLLIEDAIRKAQESGLITKLIAQYWGKDLQQLNFPQRIRLPLQAPR
ncbi:hypothetical protein [Aestuariirhabdus haliotis]|nr:hypothetical protein [Aestuariirhabdus haliotis]MCL6419801.1 hypothetical protein [Aestuariirhabdus haliotis]